MKIKKIVSLVLSSAILLHSAAFNVLGNGSENVVPQNKISVELLDKMLEVSDDEKIPVCLWYTDIDQEQVNSEVKDEIGLTLDMLEQDFKEPSDELIEALADAANGIISDQLEEEMKSYLSDDDLPRKIEQVKTDLYIDKHREVSREKYNEKSDEIVEELGVSEESIDFQSQYAPMVIAEMTSEEIALAAAKDNVQSLSLYVEPEFVETSFLPNSNVKTTMGVKDIKDKIGLTGDGVKLAIFEGDIVDTSKSNFDGYPYELTSSRVTVLSPIPYAEPYTGDGDNHATWCASVAAGNNGIAPNAQIYSITAQGSWMAHFEQLITAGVKIINISMGSYFVYNNNTLFYARQSNNNWYHATEMWFDHVTSQHNVVIIQSTGNGLISPNGTFDNNIYTYGMAYNSISVNGFSNNSTDTVLSDDFVYNYSYLSGDRGDKPDVVGMANIGGGGTSTAAPVIAGMIALLYEYKPSLSAYPHVAKAILKASCHRKATRVGSGTATPNNEPMAQHVSYRQGAGIPNAYNMISIAAQHTYGYGKMTSEENIHIKQPKYGATNMNVSMAYIQENSFADGVNHVTGSLSPEHINVDLEVSNNAWSTSKVADLTDSSTELLYFPLSSTSNDYKIRIYKTTSNSEIVRYAYAWSTNNMRFRDDNNTPYVLSPTQGVYYLRNRASNDKYLTLNTSTHNLTQSAFTGNTNQQWIITNETDEWYKIQTVSTVYPSYIVSGSTLGAQIGTSTSGTSSLMLNKNGGMPANANTDNGTYKISAYNPTNLLLGTNSSNNVVWVSSTNSTTKLTADWYLEKVNYQKGDLNEDGVINSADVTYLLQAVAGSSSYPLTDLKRYLADMNLDGSINNQDYVYLSRYVAGGWAGYF